MGTTALVLQLLITYGEQISKLGGLLTKAKAEGREVTADELASLAKDDDVMRDALQAEIDRQKGV